MPHGRFAAAALLAVALLVTLIVTVLDDSDSDPAATGKCPSGTTAPTDNPSAGGTVADGVPDGQLSKPMRTGDYTLSSGYRTPDRPDHKGVDLAAPEGTPIFALSDGVVSAAGTASGFGHWVVVDHRLGGELYSTVYGHMFASGLLVNAGDTVRAGQHIANSGNDGESTGAHLHFEVWQGGRLAGGSDIDPMPWINKAVEPGTGTTGPSATTTAPVLPVGLASTTATTTPAATATTTPPATPGANTMPPTTTSATTVACPGQTTTPDDGAEDAGKGGVSTDVPEQFRRWLVISAKQCREVTPALLAAQLQQESGFKKGQVSPVGAQGYAQFMPGTWANWGYPVDDNGNRIGPAGAGDPNSIGDAVMAQGAYMCAIADTLRPQIASGAVTGDPTELMLAGYNAGPGAVQQYGGIPPYGETQNYVRLITAHANQLAAQVAQ